jgi:CO/xanthine dehydrogenase Mo-binding subunit
MTVGGAFGAKFGLYEPLAALAARTAARPVALLLTRMEETLAGVPALPARIQLKLGAREDGTLLALEGKAVFDAGVYPGTPAGFVCTLMANSYRIPHVALEGIEVLTHKPSNGAYRAPGAPQGFFALESLVDEVARRLHADPVALRLQNASRPGDARIQGGEWSGMGNVEVLEALREHPAWQQRQEARQAGRGVGVALGWWPGGTEPAAAVCQLARDGRLQLHLGSVDITGTSTGFALMAAEAFGVSPEQVKVVHGDTDSAPYAGGAGGSKITYTVGPAVIAAAREARAQVLEVAAEEFEVDPADLEIVDGAVQVRGVPDRSLSLAGLAKKTMQFGGKYRPILGHGRHAENRSAPAFCAQLAEVSVDEETGEVVVHRLVVVQDVGRAINPQGVRGQMMGGATQGLGWALYEDMVYDDAGQLLAATWMEYVVPHAGQAARQLETVIVEVPSEHGPLGARGVGEPPVIPTAAAVANAIADATGARLVELPMTPPRVLAAIGRE